MVGWFSIERLLELGGRDVAEVAVEALRVVPVHPSEGRELEVLDALPWTGPGGPADQFGLVVAVDRLCRRVDYADRDHVCPCRNWLGRGVVGIIAA